MTGQTQSGDGPVGTQAVRHAYVHVPFCPTICPFCNFEVTERRSGAVALYLDRLDDECARTVDRLDVAPLHTLYIGGGTPSYLRDAEFVRLMGLLTARLGSATETTLEVHPSTATTDRLRLWVDGGVSRLSVGVQSFDDLVLRRLGRPHDAATNRAVVEAALDTGAIVSVDVITAVDGQDVRAELETAADLGVHHVSAYTLTIEHGTPFAEQGVEVDAVHEFDSLLAADSVLGDHGFERYEVSSHARPGSRSRHNSSYWDHRWWLGLGPGAVAHEPVGHQRSDCDPIVSVRRTNPPVTQWLASTPPQGDGRDPRTVHGWCVDGVISGLRRTDGVDLTELSRRSGIDVETYFAAAVASEVAAGRVVLDGTRVSATDTGRWHLDAVMRTFV